jgi:hypothetical protein
MPLRVHTLEDGKRGVPAVTGRRLDTPLVRAVIVFLVAMAAWRLAGMVTIHGWADWSFGTATDYCGVFWPHLDFYCEAAS